MDKDEYISIFLLKIFNSILLQFLIQKQLQTFSKNQI